jgi:hypothetical protein
LKHTIQMVFKWRNDYPQAKTFDDFFALARLMSVPSQDGHLYALSPEWPHYPFLSIPAAERKRRLAMLFPSEPEDFADKLDPRHPEIWQVSYIDAVRGEFHIAENVLLHFDHQQTDRMLNACFNAWVKKNRKHKPTQDLSARKLRADLKALGELRTPKHKDSNLFRAQSERIKARRRALQILAKL